MEDRTFTHSRSQAGLGKGNPVLSRLYTTSKLNTRGGPLSKHRKTQSRR